MDRLFNASRVTNLRRDARRSKRFYQRRLRCRPVGSSGGTRDAARRPDTLGKHESNWVDEVFRGSDPPPGADRHEHPEVGLTRSSLGLDLYLWLTYRTFATHALRCGCPGRRSTGSSARTQAKASDPRDRSHDFRTDCSARAGEDQDRLAGVAVPDEHWACWFVSPSLPCIPPQAPAHRIAALAIPRGMTARCGCGA